MRVARLVFLASIAAVVIACSSEDTPRAVPDAVDSGGGGGDSSAAANDGAVADSTVADSSASPDSSVPIDAAVPFALTSTAFVAGASIPAQYTCNGTNESPPLAWTPGPAGTLSYAVVLTDLSNMLVHSVIYDIPSGVFSLPMGVSKVYAPAVPAGAHQTKAGFGGTFGYAGPCPPQEHNYEFVVYALDVAALPGADMTTTTTQGVATIKMHDLSSAALGGKYKQ